MMRSLFAPVDAASLIFLRFAFGVMMAWHCVDFTAGDRIERWYTLPPILFPYAGFAWVEPLTASQMRLLFWTLAALAAAMAVGFLHRVTAPLFFVGYSYIFLLDAARYNNHEYLICLLSFLFCFLPLGGTGLFASRRGAKRVTVPAWSLWLMRFQVGVPYFFGGLAKLNYDWLVRGEPIGLWLRMDQEAGRLQLPFYSEKWTGYFFAWGGTLFDLLIVPALVWRRTRPWAFLAAVTFHVSNSQLFTIGIFPWLMIALSTIYFEPDWPRRLKLMAPAAPAAKGKAAETSETRRRLVTAALAAWLAFQALVPFRHLLIPGHVDWTEEGHRYAWRMKLRHKDGQIHFLVSDASSRQPTVYRDFTGVLSLVQGRMLIHDPEMIRHFSHELAARLRDQGQRNVEVRAVTQVALNGRRAAPLVDPEVDLASTPPSFWGGASWILRLDREASLPR